MARVQHDGCPIEVGVIPALVHVLSEQGAEVRAGLIRCGQTYDWKRRMRRVLEDSH